MTVKPSAFYELIANELVAVVKRPFRDEPMTAEEIDEVVARIEMLGQRQKEEKKP